MKTTYRADVRSRDYQNFLDAWLPIFLPMVRRGCQFQATDNAAKTELV